MSFICAALDLYQVRIWQRQDDHILKSKQKPFQKGEGKEQNLKSEYFQGKINQKRKEIWGDITTNIPRSATVLWKMPEAFEFCLQVVPVKGPVITSAWHTSSQNFLLSAPWSAPVEDIAETG